MGERKVSHIWRTKGTVQDKFHGAQTGKEREKEKGGAGGETLRGNLGASPVVSPRVSSTRYREKRYYI